jgi:hypothetical protein
MRSSSTAPCEAAGPAGSDDLSGHDSREWTVSVRLGGVPHTGGCRFATPTDARTNARWTYPAPSRTGSR